MGFYFLPTPLRGIFLLLPSVTRGDITLFSRDFVPSWGMYGCESVVYVCTQQNTYVFVLSLKTEPHS
jgi:hypothetical protein